jgi:hypothetical protein
MPDRLRTAPDGHQGIKAIRSLLNSIKKQAREAKPKDLLKLLDHQARLQEELEVVTQLTLDKKIEIAEKNEAKGSPVNSRPLGD